MGEELESLVLRVRAGDRAAAAVIARRLGGRVRAALGCRLGESASRRIRTDELVGSMMDGARDEAHRVDCGDEAALVTWLADVAERRASGVAPSGCRPPVDETVARIERAVARLPRRERRVLRLHSWEGLDFAAVAERMGLPDRDAAHDLFRAAMERMLDLVDENVGGAPPAASGPLPRPT